MCPFKHIEALQTRLLTSLNPDCYIDMCTHLDSCEMNDHCPASRSCTSMRAKGTALSATHQESWSFSWVTLPMATSRCLPVSGAELVAHVTCDMYHAKGMGHAVFKRRRCQALRERVTFIYQ